MTLWWAIWIGWGLYFAVAEGVALFNRRSGDTLSEHVWVFLGLKPKYGLRTVCFQCGRVADPCPVEGHAALGRLTTHYLIKPSGWVYVNRAAVLLFLSALTAHFMVGSDRIGNGILIATAVVLAGLVFGTAMVRRVR